MPVSSGAPADARASTSQAPFSAPSLSLPKGGGAIRSIGEAFAAHPSTGAGSFSIPLPASAGRGGFQPSLALAYDSAAGNGPFGLGWRVEIPAITRRTDRGLPRYDDAGESDIYLLSGTEDLVPVLAADGTRHQEVRLLDGGDWRVERYRPRIEGLFARIERWTALADGEIFWRSITRDNIATLYGRDAASRIADPAEPRRVFSWLACETLSDRGDAILYDWLPEDRRGVAPGQAHEANRTDAEVAANRLIKRIRYGRRLPVAVEPDHAAAGFHFELVFDYGDHPEEAPAPQPGQDWPCRQDPFSTRRAGFELRNYRLCRRVLMFHHFPQEPGIGEGCLVRALELAYRGGEDGEPLGSFLAAVTEAGFRRDGEGYLAQRMPPLEFGYSAIALSTEIREAEAEGMADLPAGVDGAAHRWVDLDGEGLPGILAEGGGAWWYKRNLGEGRFARAEMLPDIPSAGFPAGMGRQLLDLAGDGQLDLAQFSGPMPGFFEREEGGWSGFRPFEHMPALDWQNPELRFVDLDGDGHADLLILGQDEITWHPSLAEAGYGAEHRRPRARGEEAGPRLVHADARQALHLADMTGDGLADLVRIANGAVCYWPNLGYGRFGARVSMDHAPRFAPEDAFRPDRLRLADTDGSGTTDLIYLGQDGVEIHLNQAGNSFAPPLRLPAFPRVDSLAAVDVVDLLGRGTACLVWSSPLPGDAGRALRYVDLMAGGKPHLLTSIRNNLGGETRIGYAPSTRFCLQARAEGRPWITRLPFPVHVAERVESIDHITGNRAVSRYAYHHGFFDGFEREFRGFALVERWDAEEIEDLAGAASLGPDAELLAAAQLPPVLTRSWWHTGAYLEGGSISARLALEYYGAPDPAAPDAAARLAAFGAALLPDTLLPEGLSADEEREAARALKGTPLREEVYAPDRAGRIGHPLRVSERSHGLLLLQPRAGNRHAVLMAYPRETLDLHVERDPTDPRLTHTLVLAVDDFGNALQAATIGYGRAQPDPSLAPEDQARQARSLITFSLNRFTTPVEQPDDYRAPLPAESTTWEITGLERPAGAPRLTAEALAGAGLEAEEIPFEAEPIPGRVQRRLTERLRSFYRRDDLDDAAGPLPLGELGRLGLVHHLRRMALTPGLLAAAFGDKVDAPLLAGAGYLPEPGDGSHWISSGRSLLSPGMADGAAAELAFARAHFFQPLRYIDPFGATTRVTLDAYDLLVRQTEDALGNRITAGERAADGSLAVQGNDYRLLAPWLLMDANGNRMAVAHNALGLVTGRAIMGKPGEAVGDTLEGFDPDPPEATLLAALQDPLAQAPALLGRATARLVYDLGAFHRTRGDAVPRPGRVWTLSRRDRHDAELAPGQSPAIDHDISYSDGLGREAQRKALAEPGPLEEGGAVVEPRWIGSGWTIRDNKGNEVRTYEPFFSATHDYEGGHRQGVGSILLRDALGRVIATLHPDHGWEKVVFSPWHQDRWGADDTVLVPDPAADPDVGEAIARLPEAEYRPTWHAQRTDPALALARWPDQAPDGTPLPAHARLRAEARLAAEKSAAQAGTPSTAQLDALGRVIVDIARNRFQRPGPGGAAETVEEQYVTRRILDIGGEPRALVDALGRTATKRMHDMLGNRLRQSGLDDGERWMLPDAAGEPLLAWDGLNRRLRTVRDALRRPIAFHLSIGGGAERLVLRTDYGEALPGAEADNLRGRMHRQLDETGESRVLACDFRGNPQRMQHRFRRDPAAAPDWPADEAGIDALLEPQPYASRLFHDAGGRVVQQVLPFRPGAAGGIHVLGTEYGAGGLLASLRAWTGLGAAPDALLDPATAPQVPLRAAAYNARGQRILAQLGNGARTEQEYDPESWRLLRVRTLRGPGFPGDCPDPADGPCGVQSLRYSHDIAGHVSSVRDEAQQAIFFANAVVEAGRDYVYDAIGRLVEARGREHAGRADLPWGGWDNPGRGPVPHPADGQALRRYTERFFYDAASNLLELRHELPGAPGGSWRREYRYEAPNPFGEPANGNRLTSTRLSGAGLAEVVEAYGHDALGRISAMPHLSRLDWNERDQLRATSRQVAAGGGETTWYEHDTDGSRARKVTLRPDGTRRRERLSLGALEIEREYDAAGATVVLERQSIRLGPSQEEVACIELRTAGDDGLAAQLTRYPLRDHLGSVSVELDDAGQVLSHEEYYAYGGTALELAGAGAAIAASRRRRFAGLQRDEESGFYHAGRRHYAPWLGRWTSPDPEGFVDGLNPYVYCRGNPVALHDPGGTLSWGKILGIGAAIVVGVAVTALTGGIAGPVVAGALGGAIGGMVGEVVEAKVDGRPVTLGNVLMAGAIGGVTGGLFAGAGQLLARSQVVSRVVAKVASSKFGQAALRSLYRLQTSNSPVARATVAAAGAISRGVRKAVEPLQEAGEALGKRMGGRFAQNAAEQAERRLGPEAARADAAARLGDRTGVQATMQGEVNGQPWYRSTAQGEKGGTSGRAAIQQGPEGSGAPTTPTPKPEQVAPTLEPFNAPGAKGRDFPRGFDAEFKLFGHTLLEAGPDATGRVYLGVTAPMCNSCTANLWRTRAALPGVDILTRSPLPLEGMGGAAGVVIPDSPDRPPPAPAAVQFQVNF